MTTSQKPFDTIVLGATMAGLGAVLQERRNGQRVLLVEAGTIAGHDFVETLQMHTGWTLPARADGWVREIHAAAAARKIVDGATCDTAAFSCLLQDFLAHSGAEALYMTDVTAVAAGANGGFTVTISNRSGLSTLATARLIDATPDGVAVRALDLLESEQPGDTWAYRALMVAVEPFESLPAVDGGDLRLKPGRYATDGLLELHGTGATPEIGTVRVRILDRVAALRTQPAWKVFSVATLANAIATTPRLSVKTGRLDAQREHGLVCVAAWQTPALATEPWTALQAGVTAAAAQPAAAR